MDIFSMQCFLSAAETLNLSKAAIQMHITQPAMSVQIKKLEQEIGATLFERDSRKMILTPAGRVVQKNFASMVGIYNTMLWQVKMMNTETKCLRIGYHGPANWAGISGLFQKFLQENPDVRISIQIEESGELAQKVDEGKLDLAILETGDLENYENLKCEVLFHDYACFGVGKDHRLANRGKIDLEEILGEKIYFNMRDSASLQGIYRKMIQAGIKTENLVCVDGTETSIVLAVTYGGIAALPITFKEDNDRLVYLDSVTPMIKMYYGVIWREENESEELQRFVRYSKAYSWPIFEDK